MILPEPDGTYTVVCEWHPWFRSVRATELAAEFDEIVHRGAWRCDQAPTWRALLDKLDRAQRARGIVIEPLRPRAVE